MVSSANCKWEIVVLLLPTVKPSNNLLFLTLNINLLSTSATILKRKGDSGSPCLKSLGALTQPLALPFTGIAKEREDKPLIQVLYVELNPFLSSTWSRNPHDHKPFQNQF